MDEKQRFTNFLVISGLILWGWLVFVVPQMNPKKPAIDPQDAAAQVDPAAAGADTAEAKKNDGTESKTEPGKPAEKPAEKAKPKAYPENNDVVIGSTDPANDYRLLVKFRSSGATISEVQLLDKRYHDLEKPTEPFKLIDLDPNALLKTLQLHIPEVDGELRKFDTNLAQANWEVLKGSQKEDAVTWRYVTPDDKLEIQKKFSLKKAVAGQDNEFEAYNISFEIVLLNHGSNPKTVHYELTGPIGVALENRDYAQKTRDIAVGFLTPTGHVSSKLMTPVSLQQNVDNEKPEVWTRPLKYVGVDTQYFAALMLPDADQNEFLYFENAEAMFADLPPVNAKADARLRMPTVQFKSVALELPAQKQGKDAEPVTHGFHLFAGPKRAELLRPIKAENIIDYGISGRLGIPQLLLSLLSIYNAGLSFLPWSYGWAIILLTITVRSCLFPLSRKQAVMSIKMQELQPELAALKEKYKNAPEKFASAQMDLFAKNKCNPLSGCLWALIQLPIFFGLYQAFTISVEMRGAPFLWVDNLAAPDALFDFPGKVPLLGPSFNLLPIFTVCLFLVQQKFMMPPATTPEQEMQHKMLFYMTIGMGLMFYSVPAGMCVYFIASSLWGLAERTLLPKPKTTTSTGTVSVVKTPKK